MKKKEFKIIVYDENDKKVSEMITEARDEDEAEENFTDMQAKGYYDKDWSCEVEENK